MLRLAVFLLLGLAACTASDAGHIAAGGASGARGWRLASGEPPSHAEYAAIVAACRDGSVPRTTGRPLGACLAELGLRPAR